jgi:hypothetical protein
VERRLRAALAFLQSVDFEIGRLLRQVADRGLHHELGFETFERYVEERLDLSPRTARRLVALARSEHHAPAVATAFREGQLHAFQAQAVARVATLESARAWVERARQVSFRRLEDEAEAVARRAIVFSAPPEVVPGCTGRRSLHSHHMRLRSRGGPDRSWNRVTLCATHHERAVHGDGSVRIQGRAPHELLFELGPEPAERFASGDVRLGPEEGEE